MSPQAAQGAGARRGGHGGRAGTAGGRAGCPTPASRGSREFISDGFGKPSGAEEPGSPAQLLTNVVVLFIDGGGAGGSRDLCSASSVTFGMKSCLTYIPLAPGSLRQEASGKTGPRHPERTGTGGGGPPRAHPPSSQTHAWGEDSTPNTTGVSNTTRPANQGGAAALRPERGTPDLPETPGPHRKLGGGEGRPESVGALTLLPLLLRALREPGTFLCPFHGPRGQAGLNLANSLQPEHLF